MDATILLAAAAAAAIALPAGALDQSEEAVEVETRYDAPLPWHYA